ncbi:MAG: TMEM143 family protein [Hyphomicrobium sp.]
MSSTDVRIAPAASAPLFADAGGAAAAAEAAPPQQTTVSAFDAVMPESARGRERFIPVTRFALLDRLTSPTAWPAGQAKEARRLFRYLDHWRRQQYSAELHVLEETYEPFSPDSDLLLTRAFTPEERDVMQARVMKGMQHILTQANYVQIDHNDVEQILTQDSAYGLDLHVDLDVFEEVLLFYRGASSRRDQRRRWNKFYLREQFDIPIFQRLFLLFKLKPFDKHVRELMEKKKISRREAEKTVRRARDNIPPEVKDSCIYMKLFKNIPRSDIEMVFPNTRVRFRFYDKLRLGATAGGGLTLGTVSAAGKIALLATNPIAAAGALVGLGGIAFRQAINFMNQKQRYMVVMAQNLYFHAMADNRGVMLKLAARAAEEDIKEEILLYAVLTKEASRRQDIPEIDAAIEQYLAASFGVSVDFDITDALDRLIADGIVVEQPDGTLRTMPPREAALHIDRKWDLFLDELPESVSVEGMEFEAGEPPLSAPTA